MDDSQIEHVSMFVKVKTFLTRKSSDLATTSVIAATLQPALTSQIDLILAEDEDASSTISGNTELKRNLREALENRGYEVAAACVAYYTLTVPNPKLRAKCEFERSDLTASRLRDMELYVRMKQLHEIAEPIKALLSSFGVTSGDVDALATAITDYFAELEGPRDAIGERAASGKQVDRLIVQTRELLDEQLDVVMKFYATNNPELYDYYLNARKIDETGGGPIPDADEEFVIGAGQYFNGTLPPEVTATTRVVIINRASNGSKVQLAFSNTPGTMPGTVTDILPDTSLDAKVIDIGYTPGILYSVFYNPGTPDAVAITIRMKAYY